MSGQQVTFMGDLLAKIRAEAPQLPAEARFSLRTCWASKHGFTSLKKRAVKSQELSEENQYPRSESSKLNKKKD